MSLVKVCDEIKIGIAEWGLTSAPGRIITMGLGSCVGVTIFDPRTRVGGMVHILLPDSTQFGELKRPAKFADTGIRLLRQNLLQEGCRSYDLEAKLAGGARMFKFNDSSVKTLNIGERNVEMALKTLAELGIPVKARDTGGDYGRTMILDTENGAVYVKTVGRTVKEL